MMSPNGRRPVTADWPNKYPKLMARDKRVQPPAWTSVETLKVTCNGFKLMDNDKCRVCSILLSMQCAQCAPTLLSINSMASTLQRRGQGYQSKSLKSGELQCFVQLIQQIHK